MRKITFYSIVFGLALVPAIALAQTAPTDGDSVSSAGASVAPSAPSTGDSVSSAGSAAPTAPSTGDSVSSAGASTNSSSGGTSGSTGSTGGSSSSSSGSFVGGSSGSPVISAVSTGSSVATSLCPLITAPVLQFGAVNDSAQVVRLQAFLHVPATGTFDATTESAVKSFQSQHLSDIMGPWGATAPSGIVYITTKNKINQLACNQSLALSASDLAIINAYKANVSASTSIDTSVTGSSTTTPPEGDVNSTTSPNEVLVGAAGNASSVWASIWNAIKKIF